MISAYDIIMQRVDEWRKDAVLTNSQCNKTENLIDRIFLVSNKIDSGLDNCVAPELVTVKLSTSAIHVNVHFTYRNKRVILRTHLREEVGDITLFYYENNKLISRVIPERGNKAIVASIKQLLK